MRALFANLDLAIRPEPPAHLHLTHKEIMHLDDLYLHGWIMQSGFFKLMIYLATFHLAAQVLYTVVERQGFRLRDRLLPRVAATSVR